MTNPEHVGKDVMECFRQAALFPCGENDLVRERCDSTASNDREFSVKMTMKASLAYLSKSRKFNA